MEEKIDRMIRGKDVPLKDLEEMREKLESLIDATLGFGKYCDSTRVWAFNRLLTVKSMIDGRRAK